MAARIITRGDDLGSFRTANQAILDAHHNGVLKNTSVMMPTDFISEAAEMFANEKSLCYGLHLTITSEWQNVRWRPLLPPEQVPCIVYEDGTLKRTPNEIHESGTVLEQVMAECKAQLAAARNLGFEVEYVDEHMGFGWIFEGDDDSVRMNDLVRDWCRQEGLIYFQDVDCQRLPGSKDGVEDRNARFVSQLQACEPDATYLIVGHPAYDTPEMQEVHLISEEPGKHGIDRDYQRQMFMHPDVLALYASGQLQAIRYTEA